MCLFVCDALRTPIGRFGGSLAKGARRRSGRGSCAILGIYRFANFAITDPTLEPCRCSRASQEGGLRNHTI